MRDSISATMNAELHDFPISRKEHYLAAIAEGGRGKSRHPGVVPGR